MLLSEVLSGEDHSSLEYLAKSLATFDWYYDMSDDNHVWSKSDDKLKSLTSKMKSLSAEDRKTVMNLAVRLSPSPDITKHITKLFVSLPPPFSALPPRERRQGPRSLEDRQRGHIEGQGRRGIEKIYFYDNSSLNFKRGPDGSIPSHIKDYVEKMLETGKFDPKYERKLRDLVK